MKLPTDTCAQKQTQIDTYMVIVLFVVHIQRICLHMHKACYIKMEVYVLVLMHNRFIEQKLSCSTVGCLALKQSALIFFLNTNPAYTIFTFFVLAKKVIISISFYMKTY